MLTLGAALGAAQRISWRLRQGHLRRTPCCHGGLVVEDDHWDLGSLCHPLGQSPEKDQIRRKANEMRGTTTRIEETQGQRGSYSSPSSSSELSAEKSKTGLLLARGGGGVGSRGRLARAVDDSAPAAAAAREVAGAEAAAREDPTPAASEERVTRHCGCWLVCDGFSPLVGYPKCKV